MKAGEAILWMTSGCVGLRKSHSKTWADAAAAVINGRGVPLLWANYKQPALYKSQNNLAEGSLRLLRCLLPAWIEMFLVADRGFGRTELARTCRQLGSPCVIRIKPNVSISAGNTAVAWTCFPSGAVPAGCYAMCSSAGKTPSPSKWPSAGTGICPSTARSARS